MREYKLHGLWIQVWIIFFYDLDHKPIHNLVPAMTGDYYLPEEYYCKDSPGVNGILNYTNPLGMK